MVYKSSIVTDGVAVSLSYTRNVEHVKRYWVPSSTAEKQKTEVANKYDTRLTSWADTPEELVLVLGLDPGRVNIATIVLYVDASKYVKWSLSGGQYHFESGNRRRTKAKAARFEDLQPYFHRLADSGSSLRTTDATEIKEYGTRCTVFWQDWFRVAMRREESRDNLGSYMGKRRVLDRFYVKVLRGVQDIVKIKTAEFDQKSKPVRVEMAYGSAGPSMKASGRGQLAVPTTTAFQSCRRAMASFAMKDARDRAVNLSVELTDEYNTSSTSWETGQKYAKVYRRVNPDGKMTTVHAYTEKTPPRIPVQEMSAVDTWRNHMANRAKKRRGGDVNEEPDQEVKDGKNPSYMARYPEVRGLRFCQEIRMFVDRDVAAAGTIARLRVQSLNGNARPRPFSRT